MTKPQRMLVSEHDDIVTMPLLLKHESHIGIGEFGRQLPPAKKLMSCPQAFTSAIHTRHENVSC